VSLGQVASSWACGSDICDSYPPRLRTTRSQRSARAQSGGSRCPGSSREDV
jgi:hypothetical protein